MNNKIPVIMMFNDNYAIPAGVAILSLLKNANSKYEYILKVLHNDITKDHIEKLNEIVNQFKNATLECINMKEKYANFQVNLCYPKELLYKFCVPSLFPYFDKAIVTDVDVVFTGDVSDEFINFTTNQYFAGVKQVKESHHKPFSSNIKDNNMHFICGAGYMIYNLKSMRENNIEKKCIDFLKNNLQYTTLPDQEVLCQVCYPNIKLLSPRNMTLITYYIFNNFVYPSDPEYSTKEQFEDAKNNPIQLHYVNYPDMIGKPWINPFCPKSEIWYYWLSQTPFLQENFIKNLFITQELIIQNKEKLKKRNKRRKSLKQHFQRLIISINKKLM